MADFCIIAIGYNRPDSMKRLLNSLASADYEVNSIDLLISIDKGDRQQEIVEVARSFEWKYGQKTIRAFEERQGLRAHVIQCGDVSFHYKAVVLLEDDITVSKFFFSYLLQCLEKYGNDERIAGISLYKHHINVGVNALFEPEFIGYDVFFMQFAQSWGQCWSNNMWADFRKWYENNREYYSTADTGLSKIPDNIINWGNQSWLKLFMAYIVENDKYFVYPYHALSTNHSEVGQHNFRTSSAYQVELAGGNFKYRLPEFHESVIYDIFFERMNLNIPGFNNQKVLLDLYGSKKYFEGFDIAISTQTLAYSIIDSWKMKYRPHEINCIHQEKGSDIFVYDLRKSGKIGKSTKEITRARFDVRSMTWRTELKLGLSELWASVKIRFKR